MTWHITYATHIKCHWNWNRHYQSIKNNKLYGTHIDCMCVRLVVWRSKCLHQRSTTQNKPTHKNSLQTQSFNMIKTYTVYNPIIIMVSQVCNAHTDITSIYNQFLEMGSIALHLLLLFEVHVSVLFMLFCRLWPTIDRTRMACNILVNVCTIWRAHTLETNEICPNVHGVKWVCNARPPTPIWCNGHGTHSSGGTKRNILFRIRKLANNANVIVIYCLGRSRCLCMV